MTGSGVVVTAANNVMTQRFWNVDTALICKYSGVIGPIRKAGAELSGDFPLKSLSGSKDDRILF